ncbi:rhomboid family intramembrane serine protease [Rhodococcus oxybenzonivorans]|uniref:Rhomboid family intramembrane serine protease n=1 Tax=Rhodococcus oxybenzonivorans TaxID=1990687 RepID=A0A2S2BYN8_9NOCA|nr:rhomboid family intramembrane serine protease [Rhodococcus oxybenzonivorans]AWK73674.1 rhomboid family intramembrane serine protease [Rhodococcus oxybenzonivorans]
MTTSVEGWTGAVLFVVVLVLSVLLGQVLVGYRLPGNPPRTAVVLWSVVAVPSLLQFVFPAILDAFDREPDRIRDDQWWRIVTSVAVQDGGIAGTLLNLAVLAWVAPLAVKVWGSARTVLLFVAGQVIFGLFTAFLFPSSGAGNSGATLTLAASIAGLMVMQSKEWRALALSAGVVLAGVLLVAVGDAHGLAVLTGALLGAALATVSPPVGDPAGAARPL